MLFLTSKSFLALVFSLLQDWNTTTRISPMDPGRMGNFWYCNHHTPALDTSYFVPVFFRPGTYKADKQLHKRVTWPMKFGSPDWSLVPMPPKRMLKMEVQKVRTGIRGCYSLLNASDRENCMATLCLRCVLASFPHWAAGYMAL